MERQVELGVRPGPIQHQGQLYLGLFWLQDP